jgi:gliding motility-associated-like protein
MRYVSLTLLLFLTLVQLRASHIIGGNFQVIQTGRNNFEVNLTVFRDCGTGGSTPIQLSQSLYLLVLDAATGTEVLQSNVSQWTHRDIALEDSCHSPPELCIEQYELSTTLSLPDNAAGYILTSGNCCRNGAIDNLIQPSNTGMLWYVTIPDPGLANGNTTPKINDFPEDGYFCLGLPRAIDLSATDVDGDSLFYELVDPFAHLPRVPPFSPVTWAAGFAAPVPIPTTNGLSLDGQTGVLSGTASTLGKYVMSYRISEFRNGVLLGYLNRDIQIEVLQCVYAKPPHILLPKVSSFEASIGEPTCITIAAIDSNENDVLNLSISANSSAGDAHNANRFSNFGISQTGYTEKTLCWTPDCIDGVKDQQYTIDILVSSPGCDGPLEKTQRLEIHLKQNIPSIEALFPNVFTPNGDGINDFFEVNKTLEGTCIGLLQVQIFNRWGNLIHQAPVDEMHWDGTSPEHQPLSPGVYFFSVSGSYAGATISKNSFVTLMR